jgi:PAS domain S-box-containing protein
VREALRQREQELQAIIDSSREAGRKLREQYDLTRTITDNATTAIFMMDDASRCTFMNPAAERMTGFRFAEVAGGILHDFIHHHHPDGRPYPMLECPIDRALPEQFDVVDYEDVFIRKSGEFFPVLVNARPIRREGKAVGTVIEVRDVTAERRAAEAARRRAEQVRRLAEVATRIPGDLDVPSIMNVVTEEARGLIGAHQAVSSFTSDQNWAQAINTVSLSEKYAAWRDYDHPPDGSGIYSHVCRTNRPMRLTQAELEAHPAWRGFGKEAGRHPPLRGWLAVPLIGRDGRNLGLIQLSDKYDGEFTEEDEGVLVQLAQMASVAVENARLVESLREADRRKDEFLALLAHELRNPLAPLRNGLQVMKLAADPDTVAQARAMMERQLGHMVRLIDDLLDVSRISRHKMRLRRSRVRLAEVIHNAVETARPLIDAAGHELTVSLPPAPIDLDADLTRLAQVIGNLLANSARYTEHGGRISLTAEGRDGEVIVSVRDTGIGIPPEQLGSIFDMFSQVDRGPERGTGGLGIGLALVKGLVEMHGGTVSAASPGVGQGSTFTVRLPVREEPAEPARPAVSEVGGAATGPGARVLVVDDNRDAAASLAMMLRLLGHEVRLAHDGLQALEAAEAFRPQAILMDVGMPRLNGYEATRRIREQPWGRSVAIIALTGWGQDGDRRRSHEAGCDAHLVKPASLEDLKSLLCACLERGGPRDATAR